MPHPTRTLKTMMLLLVINTLANIVAVSQMQIHGNEICALCDMDGLSIYYPASDSSLFIEQPNGFLKCLKNESNDIRGSYMGGNANGIYGFNLNTSAEFDLNTATSHMLNTEWRIVQIYDVDNDGNNDVIAYSATEGMWWLKNNLQGKYAKTKKLAPPLPGISMPDFLSPISGVIIAAGYDKKYHSKISVVDLRIENKVKKYQPKVPKNNKWSILFGKNNQIDPIFITDTREIITNPNWCVADFRTYQPASDDKFGIADFNNDGYGDVVKFNMNTTQIALGDKEKSLSFGDDLMQADDTTFLQKICAYNTENKYYSIEQAKIIGLDWLSSGNIALMDLNTDGFQDFLWVGEYIIAFQNNTKGGFDRHFVGGPYDPGQVTTVDLNNDQLYDILVDGYEGEYALINHGAGFTPVKIYERGYQNGLIPNDLDGDKDVDILILGEEHILWSENDQGNFKPAVIFQK
jgi:hypothetical protein